MLESEDTTITIDENNEDKLLFLNNSECNEDDFLTTNYSQEAWEDSIRINIEL